MTDTTQLTDQEVQEAAIHEDAKREAIKSHIVGVYDNEGKTVDRYTIVFDEYRNEGDERVYLALNVSTDPDSYMSVSQFGDCFLPTKEHPHMGKEISFDTLPENIQAHVLERYGEE